MPRYTVADVRKTYGDERAREEWYGDWASALIYRPISFWLTPGFLRLSISATSVTCSMIAAALAIPALAALAGPDALVPIALLAFACMVLDCVDGNIARATGTASEAGAYLDFMADVVYRIAMYATVGYLAGPAFPLAALAAALSLGARLCRFRQGRPVAVALYGAARAAANDGWIARTVFPFLSGTDRLLPVLVLMAAGWDALDWLVAWLFAYAVVDFVYTQVVVLERLRGRS